MDDDLHIELDQEDDGRWIAEVPALPGVMVYGASRDEAVTRVRALAAEVLRENERDDHGVSSSIRHRRSV